MKGRGGEKGKEQDSKVLGCHCPHPPPGVSVGVIVKLYRSERTDNDANQF